MLDGREALERQAAVYGAPQSDDRPVEHHFRVERDQRVDQLRMPPAAVDAEQAVLGGLMLAPFAFAEVSDLLQPADFYRRDHELIYRAIQHLEQKKRPFDAVTLGEWFEANGKQDLVAGGAYLVELASTTPSAANIRAYAEIVAEKARLRSLIEVGTEMVNTGFESEGRESLELVGEFQTKLGRLLQSQPLELEDIKPVLGRMFDNLQRRYQLEGALDGLSTGITELDRELNGLKGGRLYVIAARPKMGKTTLATNIARAVGVDQGKPVAFFSFEMPQEELAERLTCDVGNIEHANFRTGQLEDEEWARVTAAIKKLRGSRIRLSPPRNARIESLCAQARRLHARNPQALIVVDYLQLLDTKGAENRTQGMSEVSRQLKMLAIDLDVPVIALSQLNRQLETRTDKRPNMADLRDSGAIEQDADAIVFVYRDEIYNVGSPDRGTAELIIGAQRNGPTGMVRVATRLNMCRFENLPDDWSRPRPDPSSAPKPRGFGKRASGKDRAAGED